MMKHRKPVLNPKSAIFGSSDASDSHHLLKNHFFLIFKCNVCNSRFNNTLSFQSLKCVISQIKCIEEIISENDINGKEQF